MSKIRLHGTSSGYVEIAPAAAASNNTLTAPSTVGEIIAKDAAGAIGVTSIVTTTATITTAKVGAAVTITESGIEASGIGITCANINGTQIGGRRNIVINGAMEVAQRGTSSTSNGYHTIDRWNNSYSADASMTFTQHALTSSDSGPYEEGFRYSNHAANGDTAAGGTQSLNWQQPIEAQNISLSGWNYTSPSSFITLSFWAKSSVGQTFNMSVMTTDGTIKNFPFDVTLAANTWTKVIKTIPGNSGLQIDNDAGEGFRININVFTGTTYTSDSVTNDTWQNWASGSRFRDSDATWFTTNGATFEYTGVQLEVGSQATAFEHRSFGEEMSLCQRYFQKYTCTAQEWIYVEGAGAQYKWWQAYFNPMRDQPSVDLTGLSTGGNAAGGSGTISSIALVSVSDGGGNTNGRVSVRVTWSTSWGTAYNVHHLDAWNGESVTFSSEL